MSSAAPSGGRRGWRSDLPELKQGAERPCKQGLMMRSPLAGSDLGSCQLQGRSCHRRLECGTGLPISPVTSAASVFVLVQKVALASARKNVSEGALQES